MQFASLAQKKHRILGQKQDGQYLSDDVIMGLFDKPKGVSLSRATRCDFSLALW